jgi:hypothetical protein
MRLQILGSMKRAGARQPSHTVDGKQNEQPYWCDPVPTRYRAPVSATVRVTKFPCIEYVFYFVEGKAVMPYRLWYVYISVKSESKTLILESEK